MGEAKERIIKVGLTAPEDPNLPEFEHAARNSEDLTVLLEETDKGYRYSAFSGRDACLYRNNSGLSSFKEKEGMLLVSSGPTPPRDTLETFQRNLSNLTASLSQDGSLRCVYGDALSRGFNGYLELQSVSGIIATIMPEDEFNGMAEKDRPALVAAFKKIGNAERARTEAAHLTPDERALVLMAGCSCYRAMCQINASRAHAYNAMCKMLPLRSSHKLYNV